MANYRKLIVWQRAHQLALEVYRLTENFPKSEQYSLTSQLKRAVLSIPTNIVEGYNRKSKREFAYFIDIALGSLAEVEYLLDFSVLKRKSRYCCLSMTATSTQSCLLH